ncbi:hypothetical protein LTR66_004832, partial [Elasticomyces elasticus]
MYATSGLQDVLGIPAEALRGRSFYYCIAENCLPDAIKCLENAKGNDSIAYLRFWFRDPRIDDSHATEDEDSDEEMTEADTETTEDTDTGGVQLDHEREESEQQNVAESPDSDQSTRMNAIPSTETMEIENPHGVRGHHDLDSRTSSGDSSRHSDTHEAIFGHALRTQSSTSSLANSPPTERRSYRPNQTEPVELEAVISCTSDGLV